MTTPHLKQSELAERWNMSPRTLERWRWLGQGPRSVKIGGRVRYPVDAVEAFEAEQRRAHTAEIPEILPLVPGT
jgi:predicted site-specific integrase-resolvase